MKKLFVSIVLFLAICLTISGQEVTLNSNQYFGNYTTPTAVSGTTVDYMEAYVGKVDLYYYDVQWAADSAGDGTNFSLQLSGSQDGVNYYTIGSAVIWYVSEADTIVRWQNLTTAESWAIAGATDYINGTFDTTTVSALGGNANYIKDDTITVAARAFTISDGRVPWRYLMVSATGAGAGAACSITSYSVTIRK